MAKKQKKEESNEMARAFLKAMSYLADFEGKTIVIKAGGSPMKNEDERDTFASIAAHLRRIGINIVIAHGGGNYVTETLETRGIISEFVHGKRVTGDKEMEAICEVIGGTVNQNIAKSINKYGGHAVGLSGFSDDLIVARPCSESGTLGRVGEVEGINTPLLKLLLQNAIIPVIAPIGITKNSREILNINADDVASAVATALNAEKLIYVCDVPGVQDAKKDVISTLTKSEADSMIMNEEITSGMIPKMSSATLALEAGVHKVHFVGEDPSALLMELLTEGVGTLYVLD